MHREMWQNGTERRQQRGSRLMRHPSLLPSNNQLPTRNSQVRRFFRQNQTTTQAFLELRKKPNSTHQRMKPDAPSVPKTSTSKTAITFSSEHSLKKENKAEEGILSRTQQ
jgi:hypothetical protein